MGNRYGLEIRAATEADAPGLAVLLGSAGHAIPAADLAARLALLRQERGTVLLALEWGPPSGLVALHWHRTLAEARPVARIDSFLVDPEARRRGIGRLLIKAASQAARQAGCARLQLALGPNQSELRAFCAATGFTRDGDDFARPLRKAARGDG